MTLCSAIIFDFCAILFVAFMVCVSCAKHRSIEVLPPYNSPKSEVSFKFLPESNSGGGDDTQGWEYHLPRLLGDAVHPVYPTKIMRKGGG